MNKTLRWITGLSLLLGVFCQVASAENLNVVHSGKWPPYADAGLPQQGLAIELVMTALKRAGYTPVVNIDSLDRILEGGKLGVYDVFATPWFSEERNQYPTTVNPTSNPTYASSRRRTRNSTLNHSLT